MPISPSISNSSPRERSYAGEAAPIENAQPAFQVSGLDLGAVGNSIVRVKAPLKGGKFSLIAPFANAEIKVLNKTVAKISFGVNQTSGKPAVGSANITFTPPIKIKNPAASLKPSKSKFSRLVDVDYVKDKLADIVLCGIHVSKDGRIHVDGYLKVGMFSKKRLSDVIKPSELPTLRNNTGPGLNLEALLHDIGAMVDEASFSVEAHSNEDRQIALSALGVRAWTEKASAHTKLGGRVRLANTAVQVNLDADESKVRFGATSAQLGGEIRVSDVAGEPQVQSRIAFDVHPNQIQATVSLKGYKDVYTELIDGENHVSGQVFLTRDKQKQVTINEPSRVAVQLAARATGPLQVGSEKIYGQLQDAELRAQGSANFSMDEAGLHVGSGDALARMTARDFEAIYQGIDISAPGQYVAQVRVPSWQYTPGNTNPSARGSIDVQMFPSEESQARLPELKPFHSHLHFDLRDNGTAKIDHKRKGVTEFLKPFVDLVPDEKRSGITPGVGCAPIGTPEFNARCEHFGNSPIRTNNNAELLIDGITSLPKRLELINGAKKSIYMQTMVFKDDKAGLQIADALCAAAARGVDVKVIVDALGNATSFSEIIMMNPIYARLREGGVQLEIHNNSIGEGIMEILGAVSRSEKIAEYFTFEDLGDPKKLFSNLGIFAKAALGEFDLGLTPAETKQLAAGISLVLGGKKTDQALDRVRDLVRITQDNVLELSEILEFMRHNAHLNHRWHEKYLIVDGNAAVLGGINSADEYLLGGTGLIVKVGDKTSEAWADTDVFVKGEAVRDALHHFADNYKQVTGKELLIDDVSDTQYGDYHVQVVHSRPHIDGRSAILDLAVECLGSLQRGEKAYFENAYFVPSGRTKAFEDALIAAAKRGVDVRVLMNSETSMDVKEVAHSAVFSQRRMLEGGVRVFERTGERMMHSKVGVFGSKVAAIGSWNADNRASSLNNESSAFVHDVRIAAQVENMIENDMKEGVAREIHLDEIAYLQVGSELRNASKAILSDLL